MQLMGVCKTRGPLCGHIICSQKENLKSVKFIPKMSHFNFYIFFLPAVFFQIFFGQNMAKIIRVLKSKMSYTLGQLRLFYFFENTVVVVKVVFGCRFSALRILTQFCDKNIALVQCQKITYFRTI